MSDVSDRYLRLNDAFAAKITAVPADAWDNPTPCKGWNARDIVRHVISTQGMFLGFVGLELGDITGGRPSSGRRRRGATPRLPRAQP